jgi:TctA family transporter
VSIFFTSPISLGFLGLAAISVIWSLAAERRRRAAGLASVGDR